MFERTELNWKRYEPIFLICLMINFRKYAGQAQRLRIKRTRTQSNARYHDFSKNIRLEKIRRETILLKYHVISNIPKQKNQ